MKPCKVCLRVVDGHPAMSAFDYAIKKVGSHVDVSTLAVDSTAWAFLDPSHRLTAGYEGRNAEP